jgi:hypothetical protein
MMDEHEEDLWSYLAYSLRGVDEHTDAVRALVRNCSLSAAPASYRNQLVAHLSAAEHQLEAMRKIAEQVGELYDRREAAKHLTPRPIMGKIE